MLSIVSRFNMFRPAACRLLNPRLLSCPSRSRSFSAASLSSVRSSNPASRIPLQRRWNTSGNGASKESAVAPSSAAAKPEQTAVKNPMEAAPNEGSVGNATADSKAQQQQQQQTEHAPSAQTSAAAPTGSTAGQAESVTTAATPSTTGSAAPQDTRPELRSPSPKETIYVGNLFFDVTAADLTNHFKKFGNVTYATIVHDSRGLSKGCVCSRNSLTPRLPEEKKKKKKKKKTP